MRCYKVGPVGFHGTSSFVPRGIGSIRDTSPSYTSPGPKKNCIPRNAIRTSSENYFLSDLLGFG